GEVGSHAPQVGYSRFAVHHARDPGEGGTRRVGCLEQMRAHSGHVEPTLPRHGRACPGHPRLPSEAKTWMAGIKPAMTWKDWRKQIGTRSKCGEERVELLQRPPSPRSSPLKRREREQIECGEREEANNEERKFADDERKI